MIPDLTLVPQNVLQEYKTRQLEAMVQWVDFLSKRGKSLPYDCQWWHSDFSSPWARSHTFRNCMNYFIRIVETL